MFVLSLVAALVALTSSVSARTCVCVATSGGGEVNIRSCPDTTCSILGAGAAGDCFDYLGANSGSWHNIEYNSQSAWISGDYTSGPQTCGGGNSGLCAVRLCSSWNSNQRRTCDSYGCGNYGASRSGGGTHQGTDIKCTMNDVAYAPFPGVVVREAPPYGDGTCCDEGYLLQGTGAWSGYEVKVFYTKPDSSIIGKSVAAGARVGYHTGLLCGCYGSGMTDHSHFQLYLDGVIIDPASYLFDC